MRLKALGCAAMEKLVAVLFAFGATISACGTVVPEPPRLDGFEPKRGSPGTSIEVMGSFLVAAPRVIDFSRRNEPPRVDEARVILLDVATQEELMLERISFVSPGRLRGLVPSTAGVGPRRLIVEDALGRRVEAEAPFMVDRPMAWMLTSPEPGVVSNDNTPVITVVGLSAESQSQVAVYGDPNCARPLQTQGVTGDSVEFSSIAFATDGTQDGRKAFYGRIVDATGNAGPCTDLNLSYTLDTIPDCTPDALDFVDIVDQNIDVPVWSNELTVSGLEGSCLLLVATRSEASVEVNGVDAGSPSAFVQGGDRVRIRVRTASSSSSEVSVRVSVGEAVDTWNVTTKPCDDRPTSFVTPGTYAYEVPSGCSRLVVETFGAGGGGGPDGDESIAGGGGGGSSRVEILEDIVALAGGGGGGGGGYENGGGGGGGGYARTLVASSEGTRFTVVVGGGGSTKCGDRCTGAAGGYPEGGIDDGCYNGTSSEFGGGSGAEYNAGSSTYGGGGGGGYNGGVSIYGGGGGAGDGGYVPGSSTFGTAASGRAGGGGGGRAGGLDDQVMVGSTGSLGEGGAAANGGPGNGASSTCGSDGGPGKVLITPVD